jgi:hypothetical protein
MRYLSLCRKSFLKRGWPVVSVDTQAREFVGSVNRNSSPRVRSRTIPYGIYDLRLNQGYISIGRSHDTPAFAVASLRAWWIAVGRKRYARQPHLLIQSDSGGSNGSRLWTWKAGLQRLADEFGLEITVTHFPPGASRWNPIEARLFDLIGETLVARPHGTYASVVNAIRQLCPHTGLRCTVRVDRKFYPKGVKASLREIAHLRLQPHKLFPQWNYTIYPNEDPPPFKPVRHFRSDE